jgi:mono/diheme cytochrome c family protein
MVGRSSLAFLGVVFLSVVLAAGTVTLASASEPVLTIDVGGTTRRFTREQLLRNPSIAEIDVARDSAYRRAMHYRALSLERLLAGIDLPRDQILEAVATDGFVGMLPVDLVLHAPPGGAHAYLAIEPAEAPWPPLPGKEVSAGPFYVVWLRPEASGVRSEQWPYQVEAIRSVDSPAKRWPALGVDSTLRAGDPVRAGQTLFVAQCLVCHKLNGAGSADVGPDLNRPESPTEYFQTSALKRYIRDPSSLRHWSNMQMKGFDKEALSDREIGLIVAYLRHMAGRKVMP